MLISSATLIISMVGIAGASPITETLYLSKWLSGTGQSNWKHDTHHGFEGPNSVAIAENLSIPAWLVSDLNTSIFLSGDASGGLNKTYWRPFLDGWTGVGIEGALVNWNAGDPLKIGSTNKDMKSSKLLASILTLKVSDRSAPIHEPANLLILGLGLIGVSIWGRKKFTSKTHRVQRS